LLGFIRDNVESGARVSTDASRGYLKLRSMGFEHDVTVAKSNEDPLPNLGRVVTNLKRWLIGTHKGAVRRQHLQEYLDEFTFRFNRRRKPFDAFFTLLSFAMIQRKGD
jgi:transposase-like protein